jgi:integrase
MRMGRNSVVARRIDDKVLGSRTSRERLAVSGKPYYREIVAGLHLGYRRGQRRGVWVVRRFLGNGEYKVETIGPADDFSASSDAARATHDALTYEQALEEALRKRAASAGEDVQRGPYTVANALKDYFKFVEHEGRWSKSFTDAKHRADRHVVPQLGKVEIGKLTAKRMRTWLSDMATAGPMVRTKKGAEPKHREVGDDPEAIRKRRASANRVLTILKAALNHAFREGEVASDREWRKVQPFRQTDTARVRYLTVPEAQRLINGCEAGFRELVEAALQTGCRYSELARLRVHDFNAQAGTLAIAKSKSGKARHVILTEEGVALFRRLAAGRKGGALLLRNGARLDRHMQWVEAETKRRRDSGDRTPVEIDDDGQWRDSEQIRAMADACERGKIDPPIGFHGLRHTWASLAVMAGVPLMVVARNLGHSDTRMVEKHYGHLAESYVTDAIRAGAPRFGQAVETNIASIA